MSRSKDLPEENPRPDNLAETRQAPAMQAHTVQTHALPPYIAGQRYLDLAEQTYTDLVADLRLMVRNANLETYQRLQAARLVLHACSGMRDLAYPPTRANLEGSHADAGVYVGYSGYSGGDEDDDEDPYDDDDE